MAPIVLIHGLFGWGEERPFYGLGPTYFPIEHLRRLWLSGPVVAVDVGVASSDHDRACEAFAQLLGLRVDYGVEHASQMDHVRFGTIYETSLLERWDAQHPVHLVGHSFGGNTAVAFFDMLAEDHWRMGTGPDWVASVTCICSPLRGFSLPFAAPEEPGGHEAVRYGSPMHALATFFQFLWKLQQHWPSLLRPLYNIRMDQWGEHNNWRNVVSAEHPLWRSRDNMLSDVSPRSPCASSPLRFRNLRKTLLVAVVAGSLEPLAPSAVARACALFASVAAASNLIPLLVAIRFRHRLREALLRLRERVVAAAAQGTRPQCLLALALLAWLLASPCLAMLTLCSPRLQRRRVALGARLQEALEPLRPFVHGWLARPLLRLSSHGVRQLHAGSSLVVGDAGAENDGVIDQISQRSLDAPTVGAVIRLSPPPSAAAVRGVRSLSKPLSSLGERDNRENRSLVCPISHTGLAADDKEHEDVPSLQLAKGKWHVIHAPGADHCLGTWLDPHHTPGMYAALFDLLGRTASPAPSRGISP